MEAHQGEADRLLQQAREQSAVLTQLRGVSAQAQSEAAGAQRASVMLAGDGTADVREKADAVARATNLADGAASAARRVSDAADVLDNLRRHARRVANDYRDDATVVAARLRATADLDGQEGDRVSEGPAWWQSALNGIEGFGVGVLAGGVLSPFADMVDGTLNLVGARVGDDGQVFLGDSHMASDLVDGLVDWFGSHTWDAHAYWTGAQWGTGTVTVVGVVAMVAGVTALTAGLDIPVVIAGVSGVLGWSTTALGETGAAIAGGLSGTAMLALLDKVNGGDITRYGDNARQSQLNDADRKKLDQWEYRPSDENYLANKATYDNPKYYDQQTGEWRPPANRGAQAGTVKEGIHLPEGTMLGRYGEESGGFFAPKGTPPEQLSLPPSTDVSSANLHYYRVTETGAQEMGVTQSKAAPWFDQPGGGTQYYIPNGEKELTIKKMLDEGWIKEVK
jgi:hypothetical protein